MEHLHHFGLTQDPFSNEPDLRFYFESASHTDAQRRVERGLRQHKGLTLLTGDGGMGKTLLARRILDALEEEVFEATLLVMLPGAADATGILQRFARQLGCEEPAMDRAGLLGQLYEQLAIVREDGRHAVLMIDDAQVMTPEVFAELSGLLNLEYEDRRLVSMLFVGSSELDRLVQNDASIMPRVDVRVRLQPLDLSDASNYLTHRLQAVNANPEILPANAVETLYKFGRGRPRLFNTLADNALFEAYLSGRKSIDPSDIERAASDLGIGPDPGTTYSQLSAAPVPPAVGSFTEAPQAAPLRTPAAIAPTNDFASFETDDMAELDLTPDMVAPVDPLSSVADATTPGPTVDLDEGLEAALEDMGGESMDMSVNAGEPIAPMALEAEPVEDGLMFDLDDGVGTEDGLEFAEALPEAPVFEDNAPLAEAEMTPLAAGEMDDLDDAFVELIDG